VQYPTRYFRDLHKVVCSHSRQRGSASAILRTSIALGTPARKRPNSRCYLLQQSAYLILSSFQIHIDLRQWSWWCVLIEVAIKINFVAHLILAAIHPSICHMRTHLPLEVVAYVFF